MKQEELLLRQYNQYCGKFLHKMRCRRGISEGKMARGICTRTELRMMESEEMSWKKMTGDYMLQSAREMVLCTLPVDWEQKKLSKFLLAPAELESILILANCLLLTDQVDRAVQLHQQVELYLKEIGTQSSAIDRSTDGTSWHEAFNADR